MATPRVLAHVIALAASPVPHPRSRTSASRGIWFDALVAHTLLSHVDDPLAVLAEAKRLVKPGGIIGIFDGDFSSLAFSHADSHKGKSDDETLIGALVANPFVMRQLPRMLRTVELELVSTFSHVLAEIGTADFWSSAIEAYRKLVIAAGAMTDADANAWASDLRTDSNAGVFFGACNYYAYIVRRR